MTQNLEQLLHRAFAAETHGIALLRSHEKSAADPAFRDRISDYLLDTRWQRKLVRACIVNFTANEIETLDSEEEALAADDLLASVKYQIRLYRQIVTAAQKAKEDVVVEAAREILVQERDMEDWLLAYADSFTGYVPGMAAAELRRGA